MALREDLTPSVEPHHGTATVTMRPDALGRLGRWAQAPQRLALLLLLAVFLMQGMLYATMTPPWQAPDEPANLAAVAYLAHLNSLGPTVNGVPNAIADSAINYHMESMRTQGGAVAPPPAVAVPSNTAQGGAKSLFGERSHTVSLYNVVTIPVFVLGAAKGVVGAMYALRLLGVLFGALAVVFTFALAKELRLTPGPALLAAAVVAFVPQFGFITASVNKDSMAAALGCLALWQIARTARRGVGLWRVCGALGAVALGAATKPTLVVLLVPLAVTLAIAEGASGRLRLPAAIGLCLWLFVPLAVVVLAAIWMPSTALAYIRAATHASLAPTIKVLTNKEITFYMFTTSWGDFSWLSAPLNALTYITLFALTTLAAAGVGRFLLRHGRSMLRQDPAGAAIIAGLISVIAAFIGVLALSQANGFGSQGRFWFPAIGAFAVLFVLGLGHLLPFIRRRAGVTVAILVGCGWNLLILLRQFPDRFGIL